MRKPITIATNYEEDGSDSLSSTVANSTQAYNEDNSPYSNSRNAQLSDSESLLDESRKIRKKREVYSKISDEIRIHLLEAVQNGETLKSAAKKFNVNYSSAKSILHTYRKEGRIQKKSAQERNMKKKGETVPETKKSSSSKKTTKKVEDEPVEFDQDLAQEFNSYDENMMAKLSQAGLEEQTSEENLVQVVDAFLVKGDNDAGYGYIASNTEAVYEKGQEDFAEFVEMPASFESEGTFFDPCMFLTFKDNEEKDNKRFYEDDWENPINCSLKSFLGAQSMFGNEIRNNNSFCHDDNDSGFRKGSIDLF